MKNIRIGTRVALSYASVVALIVGLASFTYEQQSRIEDSVQEQTTKQLERNALAQEWRQNIAVNGQRTTAIAMSADKSLQKVFEADMKEVSTRTAEVQKRFAELETTPAGKAFQEELAAMRKRAFAGREAILTANAAGDAQAALAAAQSYKQTIVEYIAVADKLVAYESQRSKAMADESLQLVERTQRATIFAALCAAVVACALGWQLTRSVVRPLRDAQAAADAVAQGDLRTQVEVTRGDEVGKLQTSLAGMQASLRTLVTDIRMSADSIDVASDEVAAGNQDLSARTEQTAARLQETAAAMEQLAATVQASSESVRHAAALSRTARDAAEQGSRAVIDVVDTMQTISESSARISEITGVIDGIAFQTNLLALNAAVEAARAGDQGRGFAVVAAEVRALAQRSATAAKEIKGLVAASLEKIEVGAKHADSAGSRMDEVTRTFKQVDDVVTEIAAAASEQAEGVAAVTRAVAEIDESTQQNAALVEESAAAAKSLRGQAASMTSAVMRFQVAA